LYLQRKGYEALRRNEATSTTTYVAPNRGDRQLDNIAIFNKGEQTVVRFITKNNSDGTYHTVFVREAKGQLFVSQGRTYQVGSNGGPRRFWQSEYVALASSVKLNLSRDSVLTINGLDPSRYFPAP
jgi:hypothetical protein